MTMSAYSSHYEIGVREAHALIIASVTRFLCWFLISSFRFENRGPGQVIRIVFWGKLFGVSLETFSFNHLARSYNVKRCNLASNKLIILKYFVI